MSYDPQEQTITTDRLKLRLFRQEDADEVAALCDNYNIYLGTLHIPRPYSRKSALAWMENHRENFESDRLYEFAITDKETGCIYGAISLSNNQANRNGEIGYWVGQEYWGQGYATEAGRAVLDFAFEEKQYHKVYGRHFVSNPASGQVMQKLGMVREGLQRQQVRKDEYYKDLVIYGILREN